jgi:hypothetical protein
MQVDRFNHKQSAKFLYKIRQQLPGNRIDLAIPSAALQPTNECLRILHSVDQENLVIQFLLERLGIFKILLPRLHGLFDTEK